MIYPRMDIFLFRYICCIDIFLFWICNFLDLNISFLYLHDVYIFGLYRIYHFREYLQKDISFFGYIRKKCIKIGNLRKFMKFLWIYPNWIYPKINISIKFIVDISIKDISFKYIQRYIFKIDISSDISSLYPKYLVISVDIFSEKIQKLSFFWVFLDIFVWIYPNIRIYPWIFC